MASYTRDDDEREGYNQTGHHDSNEQQWSGWKPTQNFRLSGYVQPGERQLPPTHLSSPDLRPDAEDGKISLSGQPPRQVKWLY